MVIQCHMKGETNIMYLKVVGVNNSDNSMVKTQEGS